MFWMVVKYHMLRLELRTWHVVNIQYTPTLIITIATGISVLNQ